MVIQNGIFSSREVFQEIRAYVIENGELKPYEFFKLRDSTLDHINVAFNFFSVMDRPERPIEMIQYDASLKLLKIAVVDDKGAVKSSNLLYKFDGHHFVFSGFGE